MNQSTLYRIIAAALVVLAIVLINVLKDSPMIRIVAILVCCLLAVGIRSKAGIVIIPGLPSPPHHF